MTLTELVPAPSDPPEPFTDRLRLAVAAYLARFKGSSRAHTESDLRCYLAWCAERGLAGRGATSGTAVVRSPGRREKAVPAAATAVARPPPAGR
jgi:hypothetical protein